MLARETPKSVISLKYSELSLEHLTAPAGFRPGEALSVQESLWQNAARTHVPSILVKSNEQTPKGEESSSQITAPFEPDSLLKRAGSFLGRFGRTMLDSLSIGNLAKSAVLGVVKFLYEEFVEPRLKVS